VKEAQKQDSSAGATQREFNLLATLDGTHRLLIVDVVTIIVVVIIIIFEFCFMPPTMRREKKYDTYGK
jgi:hypothetical protein